MIAAAIVAVSTLVNLYQAEQARGADRKRLKEIRALYDRIKPPDYDLSIIDPPELHRKTLELPKYSDPMQAPEFDTSRLRPEDLKLIGKYTPEIAPFIAEAAPQLIERTADMKTARDAQLKALQSYMKLGQSGDDAISRQAYELAAKKFGQEAQSRNQSLMQDFQRRGMANSGLEMAARMQADSSAMDRLAMANMAAAGDAQGRRLQALAQGADLGRDINAADMSLQDRNAQIMNSFNQRMANARQDWEMRRVGSLNDGQTFNLKMGQDVERYNNDQRNRFALNQQGRQDDLTRYGADWRRGERDRLDRNERERYGLQRSERDYQNALAQYLAQWRRGERDNQNDLRTQMFNNDIRRAGGQVSGRENEVAANRIYAQDRQQAVQGLANAAGSYYQGKREDERDQNTQMRQDEREYFQRHGQWWSDEERANRRRAYEKY